MVNPGRVMKTLKVKSSPRLITAFVNRCEDLKGGDFMNQLLQMLVALLNPITLAGIILYILGTSQKPPRLIAIILLVIGLLVGIATLGYGLH